MRRLVKILLFAYAVRIDWEKLFTGKPSANHGPQWNIYDSFATYVSPPVAVLITTVFIPWFMYREFTEWLKGVDEQTKLECVLLFCGPLFIWVMFRRGYVRRALRWAFATDQRISVVRAFVVLCALMVVALAGNHAQ